MVGRKREHPGRLCASVELTLCIVSTESVTRAEGSLTFWSAFTSPQGPWISFAAHLQIANLSRSTGREVPEINATELPDHHELRFATIRQYLGGLYLSEAGTAVGDVDVDSRVLQRISMNTLRGYHHKVIRAA